MSGHEIEGLTIIKGIERIQDSFLFKDLTFEETRTLAGICAIEERQSGDIIIEENSIGQALYLIIKGNVRVFKGYGLDEKELAVLNPGEIFGEMSLIEDTITSTSVTAMGETELLKIDKHSLERLMDQDMRFAAKIYRSFCITLSERLRKANLKLKDVEHCKEGDTNG